MTIALHRSLVVLSFAAATAFAAPAFGDPLVIDGMGLSRDIPCNGGDVGIYGVNNTVHLTGSCKTITIDGSGHTIAFENGADLVVTGLKQKVTGGEVGNLLLDGSESQVLATIGKVGEPGAVNIGGIQQKLQLTLAGPATFNVQGFDHDIEWSKASGAPEPMINAGGIQSRIVKK